MEPDVEISEDPCKSISALQQRVKDGTAFIVGATGMTRKRRKELEKIAFNGLKSKGGVLKLHIVQIGGVTFEVVE